MNATTSLAENSSPVPVAVSMSAVYTAASCA